MHPVLPDLATVPVPVRSAVHGPDYVLPFTVTETVPVTVRKTGPVTVTHLSVDWRR